MLEADRQRAVAGLLVGGAWAVGLYAASPIVGTFAPVAVAEEIIVRSPGWLSTMAVQLFGFGAKPVLLATVMAAGLAASAIGAVLWPRDVAWGSTIAVGLGIAVTGVLLIFAGVGITPGFVLAIAVSIVPPYAVGKFLTLSDGTTNRRPFLQRTAGVIAAGAISVAGLRLLFDQTVPDPESDQIERPLAAQNVSVSIPSGESRFGFGSMPAAVTPPEEHYVVDINISRPNIDPDSWTLDIEGAVDESYSLSYEELLDHEASVEQTMTMVCISNRVGGDLIGTAHWSGVPLAELIDAATPTADAVDVVTHAADGYSEALPLEQVEREDILIAFAMGDRTLAREHGFPARLLIPGRYGMKMTKWIDRIELATADHEAYWEARGWDEAAVVNPMSYIRATIREDDHVLIGGVAFAGLETGFEEIDTVEVSIDGGETWTDAELEEQVAPHAWRRWRLEVEAPEPTAFDVVSRVVTQDGTVQTAEESSPAPSGATGWHSRSVER